MVRCKMNVVFKLYRVCLVGRNKLLINHLGKLFVTSDAATIIRELEVVHPAAKLLVMASQAQETEVSLCRNLPVVTPLRVLIDGRRNKFCTHSCWRTFEESGTPAHHGFTP